MDLHYPAGEGRQNDIKQHPSKVDGYDSKKAAGIERSKIIRRVMGIDQDSPDQETGKDKKKVDAAPSKPYSFLEECRNGASGQSLAGNIMKTYHRENGDSAQPIELGDPRPSLMNFRLGDRTDGGGGIHHLTHRHVSHPVPHYMSPVLSEGCCDTSVD